MYIHYANPDFTYITYTICRNKISHKKRLHIPYLNYIEYIKSCNLESNNNVIHKKSRRVDFLILTSNTVVSKGIVWDLNISWKKHACWNLEVGKI